MSIHSNQSAPMYEVAVNHDGQYSTWLVGKAMPNGWTPAGMRGSKDACLAFIREAWTDMRPLSLGIRTEPAQSAAVSPAPQ